MPFYQKIKNKKIIKLVAVWLTKKKETVIYTVKKKQLSCSKNKKFNVTFVVIEKKKQ